MKTIIKKLFILTMLVTAIAVFAVAAPANAQTPDGETPANEGVCDVLIGSTPGLYGLCVAFCEAQGCEATFEPGSGEVTFDPDCKPSDPKLLENYNRRMQPGDLKMPCVNVAVDECPCWTEAELDLIADGGTNLCRTGDGGSWIMGADATTRRTEQAGMFTPQLCWYESFHPFRDWRFIPVTVEESENCRDSILAECTSRGF